MKKALISLLTIFALFCEIDFAFSTTVTNGEESQQQVSLTFYPNNTALVSEKRTVPIEKGENDIIFTSISQLLRDDTVFFRHLPNDFLAIQQIYFDDGNLTQNKIARQYIGKEVIVSRSHPSTGEDIQQKAVLLGYEKGAILQLGGNVEVNYPGRIIFPDFTKPVRPRATLTTHLRSDKKINQQIEFVYLTSGLSWLTDYALELHEQQKVLNLTAWVTLSNFTGVDFNSAGIQLMAGDVNMMRQAEQPRMKMAAMNMEADFQAREEEVLDYHMFSLDERISLAHGAKKRVVLLASSAVSYDKKYVLQGVSPGYRDRSFEGGKKQKIDVVIEFQNNSKNNLGEPLPRGTMRVYSSDSNGRIHLVGEQFHQDIAANDLIRLQLGKAFDVWAEKKQTDFKKIAGTGRQDYIFESAFQFDFRNEKNENVTIALIESFNGDWQILAENLKHSKETSQTAAWQVEVAAGESKSLTYRVRVKQ